MRNLGENSNLKYLKVNYLEIVNMSDSLERKQYCPKCGQAWAVHNDDGSCIDDEQLEKDKKIIDSVNPGSPLKWAMDQLSKHLQTNMNIMPIAESLRLDINEYGNVELILELKPEIAVIVGESMMAAGRRPNFLEEDEEDDPE
jgi:ribosomal protein S27AE